MGQGGDGEWQQQTQVNRLLKESGEKAPAEQEAVEVVPALVEHLPDPRPPLRPSLSSDGLGGGRSKSPRGPERLQTTGADPFHLTP